MARVAMLFLLACIACTSPLLVEGGWSGSGSGSGFDDYTYDSKMPIDQEPDTAVEDKYIVEYQEDPDFKLCERYPHGEKNKINVKACVIIPVRCRIIESTVNNGM